MTKRVQDRYRAGARRTSAQPLAASWRPDGETPRGQRRKRKPAKRGLRGFLSTYTWRIYLVPVLVAITVLVFMDIRGQDGGSVDAGPISGVRGEQETQNADQPVDPQATEKAAVPPDLNIPTAELPNGAPYAQTGQGEFDVQPGRGERLGNGGELFTYSVEIERGIDLSSQGGNDTFGSLIDSTLADPRGWAATGQVSVQRVDGDDDPDIRITLATPDTVHKNEYCGYSIRYESSCWRRSESRVMINLARWVRGAVVFAGDSGNYRIYAINHEIGHAFGNGHVGCGKTGDLAPVMMQQSFGVANNYVAQLNDQVGNADPVQPDGKTCRYNPWPNPQAQPPA
ncbi:DUF3152 domain-containing protein [Actinophytocola sediminis]